MPQMQIEMRDGHGKVMEKYFVKSLGNSGPCHRRFGRQKQQSKSVSAWLKNYTEDFIQTIILSVIIYVRL